MVAVAQRAEERDVCVERIDDVHLRHVASATDRVTPAGRVLHRHVEIGEIEHVSGHDLARRQRDRRAQRQVAFVVTAWIPSATARHDHPALQHDRVVFRADAREIAGHRVAGRAPPRPVEIRRARLRIADEDVDLEAAAGRGADARVQERGDLDDRAVAADRTSACSSRAARRRETCRARLPPSSSSTIGDCSRSEPPCAPPRASAP